MPNTKNTKNTRPRTRGEILDRLAICQTCDHYTPKRARPALPGDGYCDDLSCSLSARGLVAYIRNRAKRCPNRVWQIEFNKRHPNPKGTRNNATSRRP